MGGGTKQERRNARTHLSQTARHKKMLKELAKSCEKSPTTIAAMLLAYALEDSAIIKYFQDKYNVNPVYLVRTTSDPASGYRKHYLIGGNS